ncbi:hypothetical protein PSTT_03470, partial [Puccinia striiformis]
LSYLGHLLVLIPTTFRTPAILWQYNQDLAANVDPQTISFATAPCASVRIKPGVPSAQRPITLNKPNFIRILLVASSCPIPSSLLLAPPVSTPNPILSTGSPTCHLNNIQQPRILLFNQHATIAAPQEPRQTTLWPMNHWWRWRR